MLVKQIFQFSLTFVVFFSVLIDFHCVDKNTVKVNGNQHILSTVILQYIFYYVPQKKGSSTGLE